MVKLKIFLCLETFLHLHYHHDCSNYLHVTGLTGKKKKKKKNTSWHFLFHPCPVPYFYTVAVILFLLRNSTCPSPIENSSVWGNVQDLRRSLRTSASFPQLSVPASRLLGRLLPPPPHVPTSCASFRHHCTCYSS